MALSPKQLSEKFSLIGASASCSSYQKPRRGLGNTMNGIINCSVKYEQVLVIKLYGVLATIVLNEMQIYTSYKYNG
jgi:hypothetical protein